MSLHRRAAKRDSNEPAIVSALEALGCVVWRVSGKGLPDLIVLRAGKTWLADVKGPKEKPTPAQEKAWEAAATKARCAVFILRTPEDAAKMLNNALRPWEPERFKPPSIIAPTARVTNAPPKRPRKGDASKAREEGRKRLHRESCRFNGCETGELCGTSAKPGYTPPRSTPVDAAKEAEATFAPAEPRRSKVCLDPDKMNGAGDQFPGSDYD